MKNMNMFQTKANAWDDLLVKLDPLNLSFQFVELETYEKITLAAWEPDILITISNPLRGRIFGLAGQVEFRKVGAEYWLTAIIPENLKPIGWDFDRTVDATLAISEVFLLDETKKGWAPSLIVSGYNKARIILFRDADYQLIASWWQELTQ